MMVRMSMNVGDNDYDSGDDEVQDDDVNGDDGDDS